MTEGKLIHATEAAKFLQSEFKLSVSDRTVCRALKEAGLRAAEKVKKPDLFPKNIKEHYEFALASKDWIVADLGRVVWSDETKINRFCLDGMSWCWVKDGEELKEHQIKKTAKHGGRLIIIWRVYDFEWPRVHVQDRWHSQSRFLY